jgi:hypothetical protein
METLIELAQVESIQMREGDLSHLLLGCLWDGSRMRLANLIHDRIQQNFHQTHISHIIQRHRIDNIELSPNLLQFII